MGTRRTYDALGRPTEVQQDSELGVLSTTYAYLPGFLTRVTAPGGGVTLTSYQTFDQPSTDQVRGIAHPEGAYTDIPRDVFGKPTSITRRNLDRSIQRSRLYAYDAFQQLCRTYEPETGTTLMGYDAAGNLAWSAAGLPWSTTCADADTQPVVDRSSTRTYDKRNRLSVLEFADDTGEQVWTYTPDSLPDKVYTYNDAGRTQTVYNAYSYNSRRMLGSVGELLNYPGWTWSLGYGYDKNGFLTAQTYPDTSSYQFAVNALGQTTGITGTSGTYVSGASYHPNGALKQFTYGNGIVHTLEQNARGLPQRSKDAYGTGPAVLDDNYVYDGNGNVAAILDGRPAYPGRPAGWSSRTMTYDGLNRLTSVDAPMFNGTISYTYDVLDNIETLVDATRNLRYCYEAFSNRLDFIRSGASDCTSGTATTSFDFDVQGNIRWKNNQAYKFTFDNRLREVVGKESYRYDAHGRRVTQDAPTLATIRSFYRNDGQLVYQANGRTGKNLAYLYLAGSLVATREQPTAGGAATLKFHHTDALGSPVAVTDAARGVIEWSDHEPYGKVVHRPLRDGPGFTGHVEDAQTGLNYMQQRYYDPVIGGFLSVDPVAVRPTGDNFCRYCYARNNPYRFTDPDGRDSVGELIDQKGMQAAQAGDHAATYGWAFLATTWNWLGAEGLSQTLDKGSSAGKANNAMAVLEVATLGKGSTALRVGEHLAEGAGKLTIKGMTSHAVDQAINRGVKPASILDAIKSPLKLGEVVTDAAGRQSQKIIGQTATVVVNPTTGKVVTVYPTSSKVAEKLLKEAK